MEVLAVFDEKNYDDTTKVYEKYNVRGVIFRDGCSAVRMANIRCPAAGWKRERVF